MWRKLPGRKKLWGRGGGHFYNLMVVYKIPCVEVWVFSHQGGITMTCEAVSNTGVKILFQNHV